MSGAAIVLMILYGVSGCVGSQKQFPTTTQSNVAYSTARSKQERCFADPAPFKSPYCRDVLWHINDAKRLRGDSSYNEAEAKLALAHQQFLKQSQKEQAGKIDEEQQRLGLVKRKNAYRRKLEFAMRTTIIPCEAEQRIRMDYRPAETGLIVVYGEYVAEAQEWCRTDKIKQEQAREAVKKREAAKLVAKKDAEKEDKVRKQILAVRRKLAIGREESPSSVVVKCGVLVHPNPKPGVVYLMARLPACTDLLEDAEGEFQKLQNAKSELASIQQRNIQSGKEQLLQCLAHRPKTYLQLEESANCFGRFHELETHGFPGSNILYRHGSWTIPARDDRTEQLALKKYFQDINAASSERLLMAALKPLRAKRNAKSTLCEALHIRENIQALLNRERRVGRRSGFVNRQQMHAFATMIEFYSQSLPGHHREFRRTWSRKLNRRKDCR